uniref:Uncharacterized protein n=1 Tax=Plectus sambesii TaxID=2011161 RepID=A0A914V8V3_9BILA
MWDPETALDLHIVLRSGRYLRLSFCWSVDVSPHDFATVAVIDGAAIRVTPFGKFVIPPPMAKLSIATSAPVNQVAWSKDGRLAALLHNNTIATFTIADDGWKNDQVLAAESLPSDSIVYRIAWNGDGGLTAVLAKANWTLISMRLDANAWRIQDTLHTSDVPIIANCAVKDGHYLQLTNGDWLQRRNDSTTPFEPMLDEGQAVRFRSPNCFSCAVVVVDDVAKAIGLASTYQLYVNNKELATNVNSFAIHDEFVLVTTLAHQLHCIELKSLREAGELSLGAGRAVERGSRLVCACAASTRVILQMPRGNLEAIDPRPLVLHALKRLIDERMYLQALMCMKRHRINMNLLYDHDPQKLTENMAEFVEKISDPLLLNLFLMDLVDDDTTRS